MLKKIQYSFRVLLILLSVSLTTSCGVTSTNISSVKKDGYNNKIQNVAVIFNTSEVVDQYVDKASEIIIDSLNKQDIKTTLIVIPNLKKGREDESDEVLKQRVTQFVKDNIKNIEVEYFLIYEAKAYKYSGGYYTWPMEVEFELMLIDNASKDIIWKSKLVVARKSLSGNVNSIKAAEDSAYKVIDDLKNNNLI